MELSWTVGDNEPDYDSQCGTVSGRTWKLGPFIVGWFRRLDGSDTGFWFVGVQGTRLTAGGGW